MQAKLERGALVADVGCGQGKALIKLAQTYPQSRYVCLEINSSDKLEENIGVLGAFFYSVSVLYCMTTSFAGHGEGLGTVGLPESKIRELYAEAGFSNVRRVPMENPFNILYEVTP